MSEPFNITSKDNYELNRLMLETLNIQSHFELLMWLQGNFQKYLPHDAMIVAWGDFSIGIIYIDVVSSLPGVRTGNVSNKSLNAILINLFSKWLEYDKKPLTISVEKGVFHGYELNIGDASLTLKKMKSGLIHGIKDFRGGHDCLYFFANSSRVIDQKAEEIIARFLPYIDCTLRQLEHLPEQLPGVAVEKVESEIDDELAGTLSSREIEIMDWVKGGKTNQDIGIILNISAFTVKNHMQRIFKKLDVLNRAQAVSKFNRIYNSQ